MGPKFKLIQAFMVFLVTCKNDEDQSKNELTRVLLSPIRMMLQMKFYFNRPAGLRDIHV